MWASWAAGERERQAAQQGPVVDDLRQGSVAAEGDAAAGQWGADRDAAAGDADAADRVDQPLDLDGADVAGPPARARHTATSGWRPKRITR